MKIAFSTLACPYMTWPDIYAMAKDIGFDGIEMRGIGANIFAVYGSPFAAQKDSGADSLFDESKIEAAIDKLKSLRLTVPCFSTDCCLKYKDKREENFTNLTAYIKMAKRFGTPFLRILADRDVRPEGEADDAFIVEQLKALAPVAEEHGVTLLVETNGVYANTERLRNLLTETASDAVAALWDIHHPYRVMGESPETTVQNLGAFIRYIHAKDSAVENGKIKYKLMGEGDLPIKEMMLALRSINYDGYVSLEWVKRWAADLEEADIVFPHFVEYMQPYLEQKDGKGKLFENNAGTGYFIWEKESLISLTFPQLLDRIAEEFPDQQAFKYTTLDYARTYKEFRDEVDHFARALISMGVKRGDKVSIWATNVPEWFITFWAATKIGAILVTVNTAYKVHEAEFLLRQSDTHTLVMIDGYKDSNYSAIIRELCPELAAKAQNEALHARRLPFLRNVITVGFEIPGAVTWEQAMSKAELTPHVEVYQRMAMINVNDVCNMQYTSGTTGFPKGVMLTHYNVVNNGKNIGDRMDLSTADRMMIHVPMFHCFGMVLAMTACVTHGVTLCPIPAFSPKLSIECVTKEKITAFHGVPTMFIAMLEHPDFPGADFSHVRTGIMAGSPCPVKVMRDVLEQMNMTEITIVYGQTESAPGCTMSRSDDSVDVKVNTVGGALPGIECKIVDPVTGEDLPDEADGEFVARGYNIMKGYYKMPEATANVIDADGWLHTGDLARRMPDGNYKITGRIKDMIIRGGENIYPKEIEDFIYTHEAVRDVQVVGVPDQQYGEEIFAAVILKEGAELTEQDVKEFVRSHMAKHKMPRYVRFVNDFPMNAAGKILKYKISEDAAESLGL